MGKSLVIQSGANKKETKKLLWENNSVTTTFNSQFISTDLSNYKMCWVSFKQYANSAQYNGDTYVDTLFFVDGLKHSVNSKISGTSYSLVRYFTVMKSGVYFSPAYSALNNAGSMNQDDLCLIPFQIYGINPKWDIEEVWTNPLCDDRQNGTGAITITPSLTAYDAIFIEFRVRYTAFCNFYNMVLCDIDGLVHGLFTKPTDANYRFLRLATVNQESTAFTTSYWCSNTISAGSGADVSVPYKIFGIKFNTAKDLLWTNDNMDNKYDFSQAVDLSLYDLCLIKYRSHCTTGYDNSYWEVLSFIDDKQHVLYTFTTGSCYCFWRFFTPKATEVDFTTSYWATGNSSTQSGSGRDVCVPYQIYGLNLE